MTYTDAQALLQFQAPGNTVRFRYERLDKLNNTKGFLPAIVEPGGSINYDYTGDIKRTGNVIMLDSDTSVFDFYNDRIRPWMGVQMPDGSWYDFAVGLFLVSAPTRHYDAGLITRDCQLFDQAQTLKDLVPTNISLYGGYYLAAGSVYTDEVVALLNNAGILNIDIVPSSLTLPTDRAWRKGNAAITSQQVNDSTVWALGANTLQIVNDLLLAINYAPLWFDGMGQAKCYPFVTPDQDGIDHAYATTSMSIILPQVDQTQDLFSVPNVIMLAVSQPDRPQLTSLFVNSDPSSPVSTVNRGRRVVFMDTSVDAADQSTLDQLAYQKAVTFANIYESVDWQSMGMPNHGDRDIIQFTHTGLGISAKYAEMKWSLTLAAGGVMAHTMRRVVNIDAALVGDPDSGA